MCYWRAFEFVEMNIRFILPRDGDKNSYDMPSCTEMPRKSVV